MSPRAATSEARRRMLRFRSGNTWSPHQLALAAVSSLGAVLYLAALHAAAGGFDSIYWLLALGPALLVGVNSSGAPAAYWALMLFGWFYLTPSGSFSLWSVPAAVGALLGHVTSALSAAAPPEAAFPGSVIRRWLWRTLLAAGAAVTVGGAAALLRGRVDGWGAGAQVVALLGLAAGITMLRNDESADVD